MKTKVNTVKKENEKLTTKAPVSKSEKVEKATTKVAEILKISAEDRIKRLENLQILANKFQFLKEKEHDFNKYMSSNDGLKEKIVLSNQSGYSIDVTNTEIVREIQQVISQKLSECLANAEQEITEFSI